MYVHNDAMQRQLGGIELLLNDMARSRCARYYSVHKINTRYSTFFFLCYAYTFTSLSLILPEGLLILEY